MNSNNNRVIRLKWSGPTWAPRVVTYTQHYYNDTDVCHW